MRGGRFKVVCLLGTHDTMGAGSATDDEGPSDSGKCVALACGACSCAQGGAANRVGRTRRSLSSSIVPPHVTAPLRQAAAAPLPSSRTLHTDDDGDWDHQGG